ncbi:MAG TPA: DUF1326 domain-containing protein [Ktedonobacterales bacterium]
MASAATTTWRFSGDYFENCNCSLVCPCEVSPNPQLTAQPTQGACEAAVGFHVDHGNFGDVSLDGLNVALFVRTPGPMADGNWSVAAYIDERANDHQREALQTIFTGAAGGPLAGLAPLISKVLGITTAPITFGKEGMRRSLQIPGKAHLAVHAIPSGNPDEEIWAKNINPFSPAGVALAIGDEGSGWEDYGMRWDNSGKNAHYASIIWSNA